MVCSPLHHDQLVPDFIVVDYQLGNGKRSSLAVPQHLPPLIPKAIDALSTAPGREAGMSSGTVCDTLIPIRFAYRASDITNAPFSTSATLDESKHVRSRRETDQAERDLRGDGGGVLECFSVVQQDRRLRRCILSGSRCLAHDSSLSLNDNKVVSPSDVQSSNLESLPLLDLLANCGSQQNLPGNGERGEEMP